MEGQGAAMLMIKSYKVCYESYDPDCLACSTDRDLLQEKMVVEFRATNKFKNSLLLTDATLSDRSLGWYSFTHEEFDFDPNTGNNHITWIPAANYSHCGGKKNITNQRKFTMLFTTSWCAWVE
jgi:hypothetical protein